MWSFIVNYLSKERKLCVKCLNLFLQWKFFTTPLKLGKNQLKGSIEESENYPGWGYPWPRVHSHTNHSTSS